MVLRDCGQPESSNIANNLGLKRPLIGFDENRLRRAKSIFAVFELSPPPFTFVNHIETIP
jgi:hypothetical protein